VKKLVITIAIAALLGAAPAQAHLVRVPDYPGKSLLANRLASQTINVKHARYVCKHGANAHQRWACKAVKWLVRERNETKAAMAPRVSSSAWAWYLSSDTQCVTNHEGAFTTNTGNGYYGRFQMDVSFQNETAYGRAAYRRYGTADRWPPAVQVQHAHDIWSYAGWSRWPTYARYCS